MVSTLIVRDVTLAVNGAPDTQLDPRGALAERVEAVSAFDDATVEECIEVLQPVASGDEVDHDVLEALMLLALARPEACARFEVSGLSAGRRLAAALEAAGEVDRTVAVLELLAERFPGNRGVERDLAAVMRRRGKVEELIERYLERANHLLKTGHTPEAIDQLREVLLLDRNRKDVARMIRDLRYQEVDEGREGKRRRRTVFLTLLFSLALSLAVLREIQIQREFDALPAVTGKDEAALHTRLASLEGFVQRYPVWHGSLGVLSERGELRVELERIEQERADAAEHKKEADRQSTELAEQARERGLLRIDSGDYASALKEFQSSLHLAPADWPRRERVERDVAAISKWLEENHR